MRVLDPLEEEELYMLVNNLTSGLGTELMSSAKLSSVPNC